MTNKMIDAAALFAEAEKRGRYFGSDYDSCIALLLGDLEEIIDELATKDTLISQLIETLEYDIKIRKDTATCYSPEELYGFLEGLYFAVSKAKELLVTQGATR